MASAERWGGIQPGVICWGLFSAGATAGAVSAQVLPADVPVPEPECFSKAARVKSEAKQTIECVDAVFSAGTAAEVCIQVEQSRLRTWLLQMSVVVWCSSGLLLGVVLVWWWEWLLGAYTRKLAPSQLFG